MASPRPANPSYLRWFASASAVSAAFWFIVLVVDAPHDMVRNGISAAGWTTAATCWLVTWRRDRAAYDRWLDGRAESGSALVGVV